MASPNHRLLFLLFSVALLLPYSAKSDDEVEKLLDGINRYRASLNLTALTENKNADCLADELADDFKHQDCNNATGANTVPGTEPQFANYPKLLAMCNLNSSLTRDGAIMPACVPDLEPRLLLSNYTQSQYSQYLNDSSYTGVGISSEDDWMVVILTTSTPTGNFAPAGDFKQDSNSGFVYRLSLNFHLLPLFLGFLLVLLA